MTQRFVTFAPFALLLPMLGCLGAPKSVSELDKMTPEAYENWKQRSAAVAEELAIVAMRSEAKSEDVIFGLSATMRLLAEGVASAQMVELIAEDPAYQGLLRIGLLELAAVIREKSGAEAHPRVLELVSAWAEGLERGVARAKEMTK